MDKPKERPKWMFTFGNSKQMRASFGSCRTTAMTMLDKQIRLAERGYPEDVNELRCLHHELSQLKMEEGMKEWTFKVGPAKGYLRIEKVKP